LTDLSLGEFVEITSSKRIKRADYVPDGIPFYRSKEVIERAKGNKISTELFISDEQFSEIEKKFGAPKPGDILLTSVGTLGVSWQVEEDSQFYFKDGNLTWFRNFDSKLDSKYLMYWLRSRVGQQELDRISIGSTQRALTIVALKSLPFSPPPVSDQKAIAHILGTLDDKIELNQKMNQTLEDIAKAIFKSWFVDFDPVRAKIEGKPTGLPPEIDELFPDEMVDSEIGEIPKGWKVTPLSEQIRVNPKYTLKKGTDAYFVEMKCLSESTSLISDGYVRSFTSGSKFQRFDTLFARITPCLENGKTGLLMNKSAVDVCWGSTEFIVLSPQDDQSPLFPYCWARNENLRTTAVSSMTGSSGRQRGPNDFFDSFLVANPDSAVHQIFGKLADPVMKRIQICEEEITALTELRDALLPKLISGELRIPDAEKFLEEAGI
jgi:type I restriction enzyme, S subunit